MGVSSVTDKRFNETFEACFTGSSLSASSGFTFHVLTGNHDHYGNVQAQVEYSQRSERWNLPHLWYTFTETAPDGATVQFVMMDTVTLGGNSQWNDEDTDPIRGMNLPGPADAELAQTQIDFIKETLSASSADYLIVAGHYPVYSPGEEGPTKQLQPDVFPYLRQNNVSAYLSGHDHQKCYIDVGDGIQYHVVGSAHLGESGMQNMDTLKPGQLKFVNADGGGYAAVEINKIGMTISHYSGAGELLFSAPTMQPRGNLGPSNPLLSVMPDIAESVV